MKHEAVIQVQPEVETFMLKDKRFSKATGETPLNGPDFQRSNFDQLDTLPTAPGWGPRIASQF